MNSTGANDLDGVSLTAAVRRVALSGGKQTLKTAAGPPLAAARASGLFGLARGLTHADEALAHYQAHGTMTGRQVDLSEPPHTLEKLAVSDFIPAMRPVTTALSLLDASRQTLVFSNNHVVDDRGLVVYERLLYENGTSLPLRALRVGRHRLEAPRRVTGSVAYLSNAGVDNFGHWLVLTFPLVRYYREHLGTDPDYYYVGTPVHPWHYESLAALGIEADRVLTEAVAGDRMLFACADTRVPPPTPFLDFSTDALRKPRAATSSGRRVYISRGQRPMRRVLNEAACEELLARHGFDSYRTEELTLSEETELFADAEAVVAPHGAGLTNLLFCHPGCVAVELFPEGFATPWFDATWYAEISAVRGLTHATLYGDRTESRRKWGVLARDYDTLVNLEKLERVLVAVDAALADRSLTAATKDGRHPGA